MISKLVDFVTRTTPEDRKVIAERKALLKEQREAAEMGASCFLTLSAFLRQTNQD